MEFDEYMRTQRRALMRFATVLCGQTWLADDLVSNVLGRAYERWDRIGTLAEPHAYVRRMLVNEHLSWRRRLRPVRAIVVDEDEPAVADGTDAHAERDVMIARLSRLPTKQRVAVVLRYYAGLSDAEIAAELGCAQSTVRSQIARALRTLRLDLADDADQDDADQPGYTHAPLESR